MDLVAGMTGEEAAAKLVGEETLDASSLSPTVLQPLDDGPIVTAGPFARLDRTPRSPDCNLSREQVTPGLQQHLAAAENRVSKALHQVMESMEIKLSGALKQAAVDIIDNLGKGAAECIMLSQRKVNLLQYQLNYTKQQALSMLMQIKRVSDSQISDAESKILIERRRAQEAEAKLHTMQESNKKLKAELKRRWQQVGEIQSIYPETAQQGLQVSVMEESESEKGGNRFKGSAGEIETQQVVNRQSEGILALSPALFVVDHSVNGAAENVSTHQLMHNSPCDDADTVARVQMGVVTNEVLPRGRINLELKEDLIFRANGNMTVNKLHSQQGSPKDETASVSGAENVSVKIGEPLSSSEDSHPAVTQVEISPSLVEKCQFSSSPKAYFESRSGKDSDEEKSSLTIEVLYCNDECLPPQVPLEDDYQPNNIPAHWELQKSARPKHVSSVGTKYTCGANILIHCTEELETRKDSESSVPSSNTSRNPKILRSEEEKGTNSHHPSGAVGKETQEGFGPQKISKGSEEGGQERYDVMHPVEVAVANKSVLKPPVRSTVTANPDFDTPLVIPPVIHSISTHCGKDLPNKDAQRPEAQSELSGNQVSKRKRKQGASVSTYDLLVTERNTKELEGEGTVTGAFNLLAAAGIDGHISSRDSRRLMQGARQLFSLAERKWR